MAALSLLRELLEVRADDGNVHRKAFTVVARCLVECCFCQLDKSEGDLADEAWFSRLVPQAGGSSVRYRQRIVAYQNWKRPWTSSHSRALAAQSIADHGARAPNIVVVIVNAAITKTAMNLGAEPRRCRVVPFNAQAVLEGYAARPEFLPRRVALADVQRELGSDAASCPFLLATDPTARLLLLDATLGDLVAVGPRSFRVFVQELLPDIYDSEP